MDGLIDRRRGSGVPSINLFGFCFDEAMIKYSEAMTKLTVVPHRGRPQDRSRIISSDVKLSKPIPLLLRP